MTVPALVTVVVETPLVILKFVVKNGVTSVGVFVRTTLPVPLDVVTPVPPFVTLRILATWVVRFILERVLVAPEIVLLVSMSEVFRPTSVVVAVGSVIVLAPLTTDKNDGVVSDGDVPNTSAPDPVSSLITPASCADVVAANWLSGFDVSASPAAAADHDKLPAPSVLSK